MSNDRKAQRTRIRLALFSIFAGLIILVLKYIAYSISGSTALLSDAIESVVNVVAAVFALGAVLFADHPADREHPYGHGKIEHFSAAFEGGLISLAAVIIAWEAIQGFLRGGQVQNLSQGLALNVFAGFLNGVVGLILIRMGRRQNSRALEADGHHILSDFWTTLGLAVGLLLVKFTGYHWLDPLLALGVSALLAFTGYRLVSSSSQALLDAEDPELLDRLLGILNHDRPVDLIAIHDLKTLRSGRQVHVDLHLVVPEFYTVEVGHDLVVKVQDRLLQEAALDGEINTHLDPCQRQWCSMCAVEPCPIRVAPHSTQNPLTVDEAVAAGNI
nr:cation diffusion facilitator family transporter [uncultured Holophaga sp.]